MLTEEPSSYQEVGALGENVLLEVYPLLGKRVWSVRK